MDQHWSLMVKLAIAAAALTVIVSFWPWHIYFAIATLLIGGGVGALRLWMTLENHRVELEAKRSKIGGKIGGVGNQSGTLVRTLPPVGEGATVSVPQDQSQPSTFSELVREGFVAPGSDFVLGFETSTGNPLRMPALTSLGIGGGQGFGKTSTAYLVMLEAVVKYRGEIEFLEIDPHIGVDGEETLYFKTKGLEPFFMQQPGLFNPVGLFGEEDAVRAWVRVWREEFERRMLGGVGPMWVLVMDEGAAVFSSKVSKEVGSLLEDINRQARKVRMFSIVISQEWKASRTGGSEMRDSIVTFLLHNLPERISELLVPGDVARQTARLTKGEAILFSEGTDRRGRVPFACAEDADRLVSLFRPIQVQALPKMTKLLTSPDPGAVTERL